MRGHPAYNDPALQRVANDVMREVNEEYGIEGMCPECHGTGQVPGRRGIAICPTCDMSGKAPGKPSDADCKSGGDNS